MHFIHPELLYGLFLLIIPILVHLFQLRRFKRESFTNVKFLKQAVLKTRKSSQIKKWLILSLRLLIIACLVLAFAQPYFPASEENIQTQETVVYLDNSYSMQAQGTQGGLLKRAVQEILENYPEEASLTLFTNNSEYKETRAEILKKELIQLPFSSTQLDWKSISLKAENLYSDNKPGLKNLIVISDFQTRVPSEAFPLEQDLQYHLVKLQPENLNNIAIDTAFITEKTLDRTELSIKLTTSRETGKEVSLAIYNGSRLLAKRTVSFNDDFALTTSFSLPAGAIEKGRIEIEDSGLEFDNSLFFSINEQQPIKVVVLGDGDISFLERIYRDPDFNFSHFPIQQIDYNQLSLANLIILHEPEEISPSLRSTLTDLVQKNIFLVIIPSEEAEIGDFNQLLTHLGLPSFREKIEQEKLISEIAFGHPLYKDVFEDKVVNFQYPKVQSYFRLSRKAEKVLGFENLDGFLVRNGNSFLFTAALNKNNSDFQSAPLIVPTFYNFGNLALTPTSLYYTLGEPQEIDVEVSLGADEILHISSPGFSFIPLQQSFPNQVSLRFEEELIKPGHFEIKNDSSLIKNISFNVNRKESQLEYINLKSVEGVNAASVSSAFKEVESQIEINALWKWFVIFALFFLLTEMLILKFLK